MLTSMLEGLLKSGALIPTIWLSFGACAIWYLTSARRYVPLAPAEVRILWKIHKQKAQCEAKKCWQITRKNKIVGFECECGHKHVQKRPIVNIV